MSDKEADMNRVELRDRTNRLLGWREGVDFDSKLTIDEIGSVVNKPLVVLSSADRFGDCRAPPSMVVDHTGATTYFAHQQG